MDVAGGLQAAGQRGGLKPAACVFIDPFVALTDTCS
jgi:hypothetical protein